MSLKYNMYIHCYYIEFNDCTPWDFQCKAKKNPFTEARKHLLKYCFENCIVLAHNKSTLANVSFLQEHLVKSNCLARCIDGYYGNPPSGQSCRPCRCPDVPSSSQYFAHSCYQHPWSSEVICNCLQGYAGM